MLTGLVKEKGKGFLTNYFPNDIKNSFLISKGVLYFEWVEDTCFFIRKLDGFWAVYYSTTTVDELKKSLRLLTDEYSSQVLVFDVVGRLIQCQKVLPAFYENGFLEEASLFRFIRKTTIVDTNPQIEKIHRANHDETVEVHKMLCEYLNEKTEQIPYLEEMIEWSDLGHILIYPEGGRIAGFFDYEKNATTLCPRHWVVHHEFRGKHIGSVLYHRLLFEANDTKRILSWVLRSNEVSIISHKHYGFELEDMYDFVMTNQLSKKAIKCPPVEQDESLRESLKRGNFLKAN